ncbi:MAG: hypothetical protein P4L00_06810 [Candidatus Acidoferrales bacterium]|nr:hypothetical protein [Candidatus Acidoferrales bacterium]
MDATSNTRSDTVSLATRTLLAAGYLFSGAHRQPNHIELKCERTTRLGASLQLLIAITDRAEFDANEIIEITYAARNQNRAPVFVSSAGAIGQLSLTEFFDALGGAVPPWRVLTTEFPRQLVTASRNELPTGLSGEAWLLFEDLVADGLEFCLGRKVNRMGGRRRGRKVSDMIAALPDFDVAVVDAKASADGFNVVWDELRPLVEYVRKQKTRQQAGGEVVAALVVSSKFQQTGDALAKVTQEFFGETRTPLCLMSAETLAHLVNELLKRPDIRVAIRWKMIFSGGLILPRNFETEIEAASTERCELRDT